MYPSYPGAMDIDRMLARCRRQQWTIDGLDWDIEPRVLSRADEIAIYSLAAKALH